MSEKFFLNNKVLLFKLVQIWWPPTTQITGYAKQGIDHWLIRGGSGGGGAPWPPGYEVPVYN